MTSTTTDPEPVPAPEPAKADDAPGSGPERVRRRVHPPLWRRLLPWCAYVLIAWAALYPLLTTAIVADDYLNPFAQFPNTTFSPVEHLDFAWPFDSGHINVLGTLIGTVTTTVWMWLMSDFGVRYSAIYAVVKLLAFLGAAVAASAFVRAGLAAAGRPIQAWRCRVVVSTLLFGSLQLHVVWSNDPVASYPMSGFVSAAIGFAVLTLAVRAVHLGRSMWPPALAVLAALFYYEVNAALIPALVPLVAWAVLRHDPVRPSFWHRALRYAPLVALPGIVGLALRVRGASKDALYGGTTVATGSGELVGTTVEGIVSGLPASAWQLSREWYATQFPLRVIPLVTFAVAAIAISLVLTNRDDAPPAPRATAGVLRIPLWVIATAPVLYWFGSTVLQTSTQKVQVESRGIGYVYTYYAVSATAVAALLALVVFVIPWSRLPRIVTYTAVAAVAVAVLVQLHVNWNISKRFNELTGPNQALLIAYSDRLDEAARCKALTDWAGGAWPDYYEEGMIDGLQFSYEYFVGEEFCPGFRRPRP